MTTIIGGNGTGTLDSSLFLLDRNDTTGAGSAGHNEQVYVNISNGNLVISHVDEFLPSEISNFLTLRTYNTRGQLNGGLGDGWVLSEMMQLAQITNNQITLQNPDGSQFTFNFDSASGAYRSVDGAGAYETITFNSSSHTYTLVQANQTQVTFDKHGVLLQSQDTNGNTITYSYHGSNLTSIQDDSGHTLFFEYQGSRISQIQDERGVVFAQYTYAGDKLTSETDRAGETTTYSYNNDGTLRSITLPGTPGEPTRTLQFTYAFLPGTTNGFTRALASVTDAEGNTTGFTYNFNTDNHNNFLGGTTTVTDALRRVTTYSYDQNGYITDVKDANGFDTRYTYDSNKNLTSFTSADGSASVKSDSAYYRNLRQSLGITEPATGLGKLVSELTPSDIAKLQAYFTSTFTYDSRGNLTSRTDGLGNKTTYTYTSFNKVAASTSADGNALVSSNAAIYQAKRAELGFSAQVSGLSSTDIQQLLALYTTNYTYDSRQNLIQTQAAGGDLTRYAYDANGNQITRTVYLNSANLTDPTQQEITQYSYDAFGNNIKTVDAQGNTTRATFDHFGNRTTVTDGRGGVSLYTYDGENNLTSATDALGNTTVYFYDAVGNKIGVQDATGHTVFYTYNADNLLVSVIDPSANPLLGFTRSRTTSYTYDVVGNRTSSTDAEGRTSNYTYDALNRLLTVVTARVPNASGAMVSYTTRYAYDGVGNRISVTNNNGNTTQNVYNSENLLTQATDASGHATQYLYDADLNQVSIVIGAELGVAARQILNFDFDQKDRLISQTDALGGVRRYAYDGANNRISATDENGNTTHFTYDRDNRRLTVTTPSVTDPASGQPVRYTTQYQYDANGNQVAYTDQNGQTTTTSFDRDNRAVLVQDPNGIQTVYTYDSRGNRTSVQIGVQAHISVFGTVVVDSTANAQVETYSYDEFNQVIARTDGVGNALVSSDSPLYVQMRAQLGIVYAGTNQGKLVKDLTFSDIRALTAQFTERYTYDRVGNITSDTDHLGRTTSFTYDALDRQIASTDALGQRTTTVFDGDGNVVAHTDALGHKQTYQYDALDRLISSADALGSTTTRSYDSFGNLVTQTVASGTTAARTTSYVYDLDNRRAATTDALGNQQRFSYDAVGNRLQVTDALGHTTQYVYDALNRNVEVIDPLGFQTRLKYDGVGNKIAVIDARGGVTSFLYDPGDRAIQVTDAQGRVTTYAYDVRGNRVTQTTAVGTAQSATTTYLYDAENHLRAVTDALGNTTTQVYDADFNRTQTLDANGNTTSYKFDALNREIQVTDAAGGVTRYAYDAVGNRLSVTDANGHITSYVYDARNQEIQSTDANGVKTSYAYDAAGNQISITHAANTAAAATTTFTYDLDNRLISTTDALGNTQTSQYDANGNYIATTDALGHTTSYAYDADNRVASITDPLGNITQYRYDGNGNRTQIIDARGFVTTNYYNADNQVVLSVDRDGYATGFSFDANGNVVAKTLYAAPLTLPLDPATPPIPVASSNDQTTLFAYDSLNRVVQKTDGEGYITRYLYDAVGNRVQTQQALDQAGTHFEVTHSYFDAVNRQIAQLTAQGYLTTYQYDTAGNRVAQTLYDTPVAVPASGAPQPVAGDTGHSTAFVYDPDNRLVSETDALGNVTSYTYDARGNRTSMTEAAGTNDARTTTYTYDAADRLTDTTNALGFVTHLELDADGNVLRRHEANGTTQERLYTFTYDADNRVISQTDATGLVTLTAYDAAGNVTQRTIAPGTSIAGTATFIFDGNGRTTSATDASGTVSTFLYDAAGNEVSLTQAAGLPESRTNSFVYNRDNRLVSATDALGTVTVYQYDGAGNKLATIQASGTSQQRTSTYAYDLDNRLTHVTDPMGGTTSYQYDALGNQTQVTNANGAVTINTFDALGRSLSSLSATGVLTVNGYDHRGNLISATQSFADGSDARTTTYGYDLLNRQTRVTDGEGFSTSMSYDAFGNQLTITHGQYLVSSSDPSYSAAKAAAAFPQTNTFVYDAGNHMLSYTDALGNATTYAYDTVGNRTSKTDANGNTTQYTYDLLNRVTQITTPEGGITRNSYDHVGNRIEQSQLQSGTAASGVWANQSFAYDANGRLTTQTDALGAVTQYTYDRAGNLLSQTAAAGTTDARTKRFEYDLDNRKTADVDALGNRNTYSYDAIGNRITVTDPLGNISHYYYNGVNQVTEVVDPTGAVNTFSYDSAGNRTQTRVYLTTLSGPFSNLTPPAPIASSQDRITSAQFDRANRVISQTAADGSLTNFSYDGAGNKLTEVQFANTAAPHTLTYAYDTDNRLVSFTDVDGTVTTFTYDAANNRLSQTISNASDPSPVRKTVYTYDANNRELSQTFDPSGLDIVQSETYDHLGNVLTKTDADGHTASFTYDLNNRQVSQTDADGNTATFTYDRVGNQITSTDARGNTTTNVYDANNRLIEKILPAVLIHTAGPTGTTTSTVNPTTQHIFDAAGNEVQTVDANGNTTTRYFDGNGRVTAQVTADGALTTYAYDGAGDKVSQTLYMTVLSTGPQNPAVLPTPPAGSTTQQITYQYDLLGRLTQTTYPPTQITTLTNVNTSNPTPTVVTESVTERNVYDAYGNLVQSYDRNGNLTTNFYDTKGRKIATVDPLGYLTQWVYDDQGNEIQQLVYTKPLDPAAVSPGTLPTPPSGEVYQTDVQYDAASRKVAEIAPQITAYDPSAQTSSPIRSTTTFTYDKVGNQLTRTIGFGTAQQVTEYTYYDAINRRIAFIDSGRILSTYGYDANGNLTFQKRYFNAVPAGIDPTQLSGSTNFASLVSADASHDEETDNTYDGLNRETQTSDVLSSGTLSKAFGYDAAGNRTYAKDEDGFITQASFDAMGRLAETIGADGSGTRYQYDAAGNRVLVFTGVISGGPPAVASTPAASLSGNGALNLSWGTSGTTTKPVQTWVVYDTSSHTVSSIADLSGYASRTATQVSSQLSGKTSINSLATGATVFFRIITQDGAGNESWTAEQSLSIPPRFSTVSVSEPSSGTLVVTVNFDAGTTNQQLLFGSGGALSQSAAFTLVSGNTYQATLTGVSDPAQLSFALQWQDAAGATFQSGTAPFANVADQIGTSSSVSQSSFTAASATTYAINVSTQVPSSTAQNFVSVQAELFVAGTSTLINETAVTGSDSGLGFFTYNASLASVNHLAAGTYTVVLTGVRSDGTSVELDDFAYSVGPSATNITRTAVSWTAPPASAGASQLVVIGGQVAPSLRDVATSTGASRIVATDTSAAPNSSTDYAAFYGQGFSDAHQVAVSSTADGSNWDVGVQATLTANEAANIGGDGNLHLAWRAAGDGTAFPNDVALSSSATGSFSTTLSNLAGGSYDLEVYYIDSQGRQVIVEWQRIDAATVNSTFTGHSFTVQAEETGGTLAIDSNGNLTVTPGVYVGPLDPGRLAGGLSVSLTSTGQAGGETTNGLATGYFASDTYNALNYKISSNEGDGLKRNFGVDANGNVVETDLLGDPNNPNYNPANAITTYTAFDGRNRKVATFGAAVAVGGGSSLVRPVERYDYNVLDKVTSYTDANNNTTQYVYNAQGTQIEEIDPYGNTTQARVDQFGNVTATVDQLGKVTRSFFDLQGRMTSQVDPLGNATQYGYDAFGREVSVTDPDGNTQTNSYDQRDRLTSQTDALNSTVSYLYDGRNNRISTIYPQNERTDQVYDGLGRVIDTVVGLDGTPTHSQRAYDAYGNLISETDAMGRTKTHVYGAFGRLLEDIDEDGNIIAYAYDQYGRKTNEYDPTTVSDPAAATDPSGGKDIQTSYDAAGRITAINDLATKVSTTYTYDLLGSRLSEVVTTPGLTVGSTTYSVGRNITYQYDRLGQLVSWNDAVTGENLNTQYDADGNIVREYTNAGYDPLNQSGGNPNFVYVDHLYSYDADRRVTSELDETPVDNSGAPAKIINAYTYDAAGNRLTWNNAGIVVSYQYDADNRVTFGSYFTGSDLNEESWSYDALSNVLSFVTKKNGTVQTSTTSTYNTVNRVVTSTDFTASDGTTQATTNAYDLSLRITQTTLQSSSDGNTSNFTYNHAYFGDGREKSVTAFGDAKGSSTSIYDVNKVQIGLNLGQGDNQSRPEFKSFVADNEGHILFQYHDDGSSSNVETDQYLYANSQPAGQEQHDVNGNFTVYLDKSSSDGKINFALLQNLGSSDPGSNLTYTVHAGDTLQSIASVMYGNPSLWYVIAEANGLSASDQLHPGTQLLIPQTIQSGTITAANHQVYSQSQIVGSTLPNLKSPPPPSNGGCGGILAIIAIIVIVVVAVVVSVVTFGAATAIAGALADAGITGVLAVVATVAATAVVGAAVAALGSIVQQGILILIGYQHGFSWKDVGAAAASGAFTGAAAGLGAAAQAGFIANQFANYVKVADAALGVAGAASQQLIENGTITSWTSLAVAAVGGYAQGAQAVAQGAATTAQAAAQTAQEAATAAEAGVGTEEAAVAAADEAANAANAATAASAAASTANTIATVSKYVSPWAQLAETYARNGSVTPLDWTNAVGGTLAQAVQDNNGISQADQQKFAGSLITAGERLAVEGLVAGALSLFDKKDAVTYFENSVGQEVGNFLGTSVRSALEPYFPQTIAARNAARITAGPTTTSSPAEEYATANDSATNTAQAPQPQDDTPFGDSANNTTDDPLGNPTTPVDSGAATAQVQQTSQDAAAGPPEPENYTVQQGDSFAKIARDTYGDERYAALIMAANGIDPSYGSIHGLQIGQELQLPDISSLNADTQNQLLRAGGTLISQDQAVSDALAAQRAQAAAVVQEQTQPPPSAGGLQTADQSAVSEAGFLPALPQEGAGPFELVPGNLGGLGVGLYAGSNEPITGDFLHQDPAAREFFQSKNLGDFYNFDLNQPLVETSPEYFSDLATRNSVYVSSTQALPQQYAIPDGADVQTAENLGQSASQARNDAMTATREQLSQAGQDFSASLKEQGLSWDTLADKAAQKQFGSDYASLTDSQKISVNETIVNSSGKSNPIVTGAIAEAAEVAPAVKILNGAQAAGKVLTVVGAAADAYSLGTQVAQSYQTGDWENTAKEATRITTSWAAASVGAEGGAELGLTIGAFGGPVGAAVGAVVGGAVGGAVGYFGGTAAVNASWNGLKSGYNNVVSWFNH